MFPAELYETARRVESELHHQLLDRDTGTHGCVTDIFELVLQQPVLGCDAEFGFEEVVEMGFTHVRTLDQLVDRDQGIVIIVDEVAETGGSADQRKQQFGNFGPGVERPQAKEEFAVLDLVEMDAVDLIAQVEGQQFQVSFHRVLDGRGREIVFHLFADGPQSFEDQLIAVAFRVAEPEYDAFRILGRLPVEIRSLGDEDHLVAAYLPVPVFLAVQFDAP